MDSTINSSRVSGRPADHTNVYDEAKMCKVRNEGVVPIDVREGEPVSADAVQSGHVGMTMSTAEYDHQQQGDVESQSHTAMNDTSSRVLHYTADGMPVAPAVLIGEGQDGGGVLNPAQQSVAAVEHPNDNGSKKVGRCWIYSAVAASVVVVAIIVVAVVMVAGSKKMCGGGNVGNGRCALKGDCCSQYGYCGTGVSYCTTSESLGTCGNGQRGNGICVDPGYCCSEYGYCGPGTAYCSSSSNSTSNSTSGGTKQPPTAMPTAAPLSTASPSTWSSSVATCGGGNRGNGLCADGSCCSQYGYCGTGSAYCGNVTY